MVCKPDEFTYIFACKHMIYVAQHIRDLSYLKAKNYFDYTIWVSLEDCFAEILKYGDIIS